MTDKNKTTVTNKQNEHYAYVQVLWEVCVKWNSLKSLPVDW